MMHLLLIYDISNDRLRTKVVTACEDYGLDRMQYSAFYGRLTRNLQEELMLKIGKLLGKAAGNVQLIPIGQPEWNRRLTIENESEENAGAEVDEEEENDAG